MKYLIIYWVEYMDCDFDIPEGIFGRFIYEGKLPDLTLLEEMALEDFKGKDERYVETHKAGETHDFRVYDYILRKPCVANIINLGG